MKKLLVVALSGAMLAGCATFQNETPSERLSHLSQLLGTAQSTVHSTCALPQHLKFCDNPVDMKKIDDAVALAQKGLQDASDALARGDSEEAVAADVVIAASDVGAVVSLIAELQNQK